MHPPPWLRSMTVAAPVLLQGCALRQGGGGDRTASQTETAVEAGPCSELAVGVNGSYGGETWIPGVTGAVTCDTSTAVDAYARLALRVTHDFTARDDAIDLERHSQWTQTRLRAGALPFACGAAES